MVTINLKYMIDPVVFVLSISGIYDMGSGYHISVTPCPVNKCINGFNTLKNPLKEVLHSVLE